MSLSVYGFDSGQLITQRTILSTLVATDVVIPANNRQTVLFIAVSNTSAATATVTLETWDGTTAESLITLYTVPARGVVTSVYTYELPIILERNFSIRATAGTTNVLHVHATVTGPPPGKTP